MKSKNKTNLEKIYEANKKIQEIEKQKEEFEEKLLELRRQIKNSERKLSNLNRSDEWRERNHKLIEYGALLEISDLLGETKSTLLGYFLNFHLLNKEEKEDCKIKGILEFRRREEKKKKIKKNMEENRKNKNNK